MNTYTPFTDEINYHQKAVKEFAQQAERVPGELWNISRAPGKWTPSQEVKHLELTYRGYVAEIRRGPDVTPETFLPPREVYRVKILPRVLKGNWFPSGAKAPDYVNPDSEYKDKADQLAGLRKWTAEFEKAVLEIAESNTNRQVRHPYFGSLTLVELVKVLAEHTRHHKKYLPAVDE